ncbi:MAG: hypothetical protein J6S13_03460 [Clostridia bacterium]|nr:hypothetical protein [Clostridia bacterium]
MVCLILILVIVWAFSCGVFAFLGFWFGKAGLFESVRKRLSKAEFDADEARRSEREQRELYNMLTYDGTPQGKDQF